MNKSEKS